MQLKVATDYAIRILYYIAANGQQGKIPSNELSKKLDIPQSMVLKLGKKFKKAGLVDISVGVSGGYMLNKRPEEINLLEIISLFEKTIKISRCLADNESCCPFMAKDCQVRKTYSRIQQDIEEELRNTTLKTLIEV